MTRMLVGFADRTPIPIATYAITMLLIGCSPNPAQPTSVYDGQSFSLDLQSTESVEKSTPAEDFNLYRVTGENTEFTIYEGNHPEGGGLEIQTGCGWPAVIAIHGPNPSKIKSHLHLHQKMSKRCVHEKSH